MTWTWTAEDYFPSLASSLVYCVEYDNVLVVLVVFCVGPTSFVSGILCAVLYWIV